MVYLDKIKNFCLTNKAMLNDINHFDKSIFMLMIGNMISSAVYPLLISIIPKVIIDSINDQVGIYRFILRIILLSISVATISWVNPTIVEKLAAKAEKVNITYQMDLLICILDCEYEQLNNRNIFEKAKHFVDGNGKSIASDYTKTLSEWITAMIGMIVSIIIISKNNSIMLLLFGVALIIEYVINLFQYKNKLKMKKNSLAHQVKSDYIFRKTLITEFIRDAVVFDAIPSIKDKINKHNEIIIKELQYYNTKDLKYDIFKLLFILPRDIILCYVVIQNVINGVQNASDFVLCIGLLNIMTKWTSSYCINLNNLKYICNCYNEYSDFKNLKPIDIDDTPSFRLNKPIRKIEFRNISYCYNKKKAINNVNFEILMSDKIAIIGKNGSGKSTLANIICGIFEPTQGLIFINNEQVSYKEYKNIIDNNISVMFQKDDLLPETICANIALSEEPNSENVKQSLTKTEMINKINDLELGINTKLVSKVNYNAPEFSGGEKQRLLMSRCFYKTSTINLFDEPTAALDVKSESLVYNSITREPMTSIIISHRIANIINSDKIIVLNEGKVVESGRHEELLINKGLYYEMFRIQEKFSNF